MSTEVTQEIVQAPVTEAPIQEPTVEEKPAETQAEATSEEPPKKEKTPEEKELARERRRIQNLTRQKYELQARLEAFEKGLPSKPIDATNQPDSTDSEELTLSRAELKKLVEQRAKEIAPTISEQAQQIEQRRKVIEKLSDNWGQEKFDLIAADLDDALGGLADNGKPKPATEAIFAADDPAAVIEYLADTENAAEADAISRMNPVQAGKAIAKLEMKLETLKAQAKPQRSKVPAPIEPIKSAGSVESSPDPSDLKAWIKWRNEQERKAGRI